MLTISSFVQTHASRCLIALMTLMLFSSVAQAAVIHDELAMQTGTMAMAVEAPDWRTLGAALQYGDAIPEFRQLTTQWVFNSMVSGSLLTQQVNAHALLRDIEEILDSLGVIFVGLVLLGFIHQARLTQLWRWTVSHRLDF